MQLFEFSLVFFLLALVTAAPTLHVRDTTIVQSGQGGKGGSGGSSGDGGGGLGGGDSGDGGSGGAGDGSENIVIQSTTYENGSSSSSNSNSNSTPKTTFSGSGFSNSTLSGNATNSTDSENKEVIKQLLGVIEELL